MIKGNLEKIHVHKYIIKEKHERLNHLIKRIKFLKAHRHRKDIIESGLHILHIAAFQILTGAVAHLQMVQNAAACLLTKTKFFTVGLSPLPTSGVYNFI